MHIEYSCTLHPRSQHFLPTALATGGPLAAVLVAVIPDVAPAHWAVAPAVSVQVGPLGNGEQGWVAFPKGWLSAHTRLRGANRKRAAG